MSYILDALRKADAQRESDPARGIHAQPVRVAIAERRLQDGYGIGFWAAAAAGLAVLASVGWYLYPDGEPSPAPVRAEVIAAMPAAAPASIPPPAVPAAAVMPPPVVVAPPVVVKAEPAPGAAVAGRQQSEKSPGAAAALVRRSAPAPVAASSAPAAAVPNAPAAAPASAPAAAPAVVNAAPPVAAPPVAGLPGDAPKLAISGGVYSANAAQRMLIVNGQVFNEGGEVGPGLVLEEIRPKAAVIRFRGSRYTVAY